MPNVIESNEVSEAAAFEKVEQSLEQKDSNGESEVWSPDTPGEKIVGEIVEVLAGESDYQTEKIPVLKLQTRNGEEKLVFLSRQVLRDKWKEAGKPTEGVVGIKYLGRRRSQNGREYYNYAFRHESEL